MKLLNKPQPQTDSIDITTIGGPTARVAGRYHYSNVQIVVPDRENSTVEIWNKLKYGPTPDFRAGTKIDKIEFPEDNIILYGVVPISMERTELWEGRVYECTVDSFKVTP